MLFSETVSKYRNRCVFGGGSSHAVLPLGWLGVLELRIGGEDLALGVGYLHLKCQISITIRHQHVADHLRMRGSLSPPQIWGPSSSGLCADDRQDHRLVMRTPTLSLFFPPVGPIKRLRQPDRNRSVCEQRSACLTRERRLDNEVP